MNYTYLGKTGIQISELGFGTMSFGGDADKAASKLLYTAARDAGINYFDTANHYNQRLSETYLGEFMGPERQKLVIGTKAFFPMSDDVNDRGASRKHLQDSIHTSLKLLKTDYIDILYLHKFDSNTPLEETLRVLDDLVRSGKILYPAVSNFAAWQCMKALGIARFEGYAPIACIQPMYNLVKRQAEVEIFPMAESEQLGIISYSPLGGGLLTGKYGSSSAAVSGRILTNKVYIKRYGQPEYKETVEKFTAFAQEHGYAPVALAVKWAATHKAVTCPLIGARNVEQLKDSLGALAITMDDALRTEISALSHTPPPATDRIEENL